jgi:hypothetical protein
MVLGGGLERFRAFIIAVCCDKDDLLTLTCLPYLTIRGVRWQSEVRKGYLCKRRNAHTSRRQFC